MGIPTEMTASEQVIEGLEWSMAQHLADVAEENTPPSPWQSILAEYGTVDAWLDHCRQRRRSDGDRSLARIITILMCDAPGRPRGTLFPADRAWLLSDKLVAAYFASVAASGDTGWEETQRAARDVYAAKALLPTWRQWGAILLEAGAIGDLKAMFLPPDDGV